jgi:drug/metabolite transporter (DMT)-like permease
MNKRFVRQNVYPVLASLIWGTAFVAQSVAADYIPPFAFNAIRNLLAGAMLLLGILVYDNTGARRGGKPKVQDRRALLLGGLATGLFLAVASNLQQAGLADTAAGKAGFITALYVVLVPLLGVFFKKRVSGQIWLSVAIAVAGLWLLCIRGGFTLQTSDVYLLLCAFFFSCQILCIDHFGRRVQGVRLACAEFLVAGVISTALTALFETIDWAGVLRCALPILYCAVFSSCVAYTLQILAQRDADPTVVTLLLSLESVFSVLAGAVILGDRLSGREYLGCVLMFAAVILAQVPLRRRQNSLQS